MLYVICNISAVYAEIKGIRVLFTCESPWVYLWLCVSLRQAITYPLFFIRLLIEST